MNPADLDDYLEQTVRFDGITIPPAACRADDGPTVMVPAPAMAALAAGSAHTTQKRPSYQPVEMPPAMLAALSQALPSTRRSTPPSEFRTLHATPRALGRGDAQVFSARRFRQPIAQGAQAAADDPAMRRAVIGIWTVAALLFATLGVLVK